MTAHININIVDPKFWLSFPSDNLIHNKLLEAFFPLFTEIQNSIVNLEVETIKIKYVFQILLLGQRQVKKHGFLIIKFI